MIAWHKADPVNRVYAVIEDGKKVSLPRYFKDRIFSDQERQLIKEHYHLHWSEISVPDRKDYNDLKEGAIRQSKYITSQNEKL